ncbi:MAG: alpha-galactosidase [Opitutae bacterium]|nr:alpha-galactosidase [Opitutae bacterium]
MKSNVLPWLAVFLAVTSLLRGAEPTVQSVTTRDLALVYSVDAAHRLMFRHFGPKLAHEAELARAKTPAVSDVRSMRHWEAYPAYGRAEVYSPALQVTHADGSLVTELVFAQRKTLPAPEGVTHTVFVLRDAVQPLTAELHLEAYAQENVFAQWVEVSHSEKGPIAIGSIFSGFLPSAARKYFLSHFHGAWSSEMTLSEEELKPGVKIIESQRGVRITQQDNPSFLLALDQPATEETGEIIGGALAWSGNFRLSFQVDEWGQLRTLAGLNPFVSELKLAPGEPFVSPKFIFTYSPAGRGLVSRRLHDWARRYALADGFTPRSIVLNSWEGAYFKFDEATLTGMIDGAAQLGVETFVLDDGWFGNKHPRDSAEAGLGDWQTNIKKLPRGLNYLADYAESKGMKFGLWIEPEMVNPRSELAERHPEWIVQSPGREKIAMRNQWLLDLGNPAVQEFVWQMVDRLLTEHPKIAYLKWDANRHVSQPGTTALPADRQSSFWTAYVRGLYSVYAKIRAKYPQIILQVCASGGGRVDFGALAYHHEFWASDNTDALSRLTIQYGTNLIYPPIATAAHVSTSPNHQTGNVTPLKFRFDVAMTGRLGLELQPKDMDAAEQEFARAAIATYKRIRPLLAQGDLYRMHSPYEPGGWVSQMLVAKDRTQAAVFVFSTQAHRRGVVPTLRLRGLDPAKRYKVTELNRLAPAKGAGAFWGNGQTFTGEYLTEIGLEANIGKIYTSAVFLLEAVP